MRRRRWRRCRPPCARRRGTRPRTATAASRRRARAGRGATRRSASVSLAAASAQERTGPSRKKSVIIEPTRCTRRGHARPAAAARARPSSSWAPSALELRVELGHEVRDRREARGDGDRVPAQRAGLVDGAERRDDAHDVVAPAVGRERHAAADDLAERGHVGHEAEALLRAAAREAAAGHHLVEDRDGAVLLAERDDRLEEARLGRDAAHVADHGLDDDGGDLAAARREEGARARATSL